MKHIPLKHVMCFIVIFFSGAFNTFVFSKFPEWERVESMEHITVRSIAIDSLGNKWIATPGMGLRYYDGTDLITYTSFNTPLQTNKIFAVAATENSYVWAGTEEGLVRFDGMFGSNFNTSNSPLPSNLINAIAIDDSSNVWVGTGDIFGAGGLAYYEKGGQFPSSGTWTIYNPGNSGLPHLSVLCVEIHKDGVIWAGTRGGLATFDGTSWNTYTTDNSGLPHNEVNAIAFEEDGTAWIGTRGGLAKFDGNNWYVFHTGNSDLQSNRITAIAIDNNNIKWIGGVLAGLARYDDVEWKIFNEGNSGLSHNTIFSLTIDKSDSSLWIGLSLSGIDIYKEIKEEEEDDIISTNEINQDRSFKTIDLYPNPSNSRLNISFELNYTDNLNIILYNKYGVKVHALSENFVTGINKTYIDVNNFPTGLYFCKIQSSEHFELKPIIILR